MQYVVWDWWKEGFHTIVYNVVVDHRHWVLHAMPRHPGANNDKNVVRYDCLFIQKLWDGLYLSDLLFKWVHKTETLYKGLYVICDG